jgi:hypothetical protein
LPAASDPTTGSMAAIRSDALCFIREPPVAVSAAQLLRQTLTSLAPGLASRIPG